MFPVTGFDSGEDFAHTSGMGRSSTTYPRKWSSGKTTVIRVPEKIADQVLDIAHRLDLSPGYRLREDSSGFVLELVPTSRVRYTAQNPVNVASVPQRSPFRYPGGKTWLVPYIRSWLASKPNPVGVLIEPFAGGGIVGLTAGFEGLAEHVVLVERDLNISAVWNTILGGQAKWL